MIESDYYDYEDDEEDAMSHHQPPPVGACTKCDHARPLRLGHYCARTGETAELTVVRKLCVPTQKREPYVALMRQVVQCTKAGNHEGLCSDVCPGEMSCPHPAKKPP